LARWSARESEPLDETLYVVSDIGGVADVAATAGGYAIPSGILNATVSGLTSRSILNAAIGPADFHGCVFYSEFAPHDRSTWFLDQVAGHFAAVVPASVRHDTGERRERRDAMTAFLARIHARYRITDRNFVKPGVAEATRVLLRRLPDRLLLRDPAHPDVAHLRLLAEQKRVPVETDSAMPIQATALIKDLS
ncbi:MAG: tellurite-like stress resistance cysteine protease StiP, partial [Candidatus Competibacteraceae bacterium]